MKATGIVRKVDELGRIVLPVELRRSLDVQVKDALEIFMDGENIVLKKYEPACTFCGSDEHTEVYRDKRICLACLQALKAL